MIEAFLNCRLDLRIKRACRFIQNQDRRVLEQHAGNRDALALAARQFHTALADMGVVPSAVARIDKMGNELIGMSAPRGALDLFEASIRLAIADIVADRTMKKRSVLRHHPDPGPQAFLRRLGDVLAVDEDAA